MIYLVFEAVLPNLGAHTQAVLITLDLEMLKGFERLVPAEG